VKAARGPLAASESGSAAEAPAIDAPRRFSPWRLLVTILLTAILLALLLSQVSLGRIVATIRGADPFYFSIAAGGYLLSYFGRAIRWRVLTTSRRLSWPTVWGIGAVHNFMIRALPAKLGETSYVVLMRARGVPGTEAVAGLVVARIYDTAAAILFFVMSLFLAHTTFAESKILNVAAALAVLVLCAFAVLRGSLVVKWVNAVAGRFAVMPWVPAFLMGHGFRRRLDQLEGHMERIQSARQAPLLFFATILIWLPSFYMTYWLLIAFGTPLTFWGTVFASTLSIVATLLPIGTIGKFGTQEAGWTLGVVLLGGTQAMGITSGLSTHLVGFALAGLFGLIGAWISGIALSRGGGGR
jgi:uncharacterized protein (TIRG00374 family)